MVLIVLLYVASIACCNWFLHREKEGNIFMNISSKLYPVTLITPQVERNKKIREKKP